MKNIRLIISYDGGSYIGWQKTPDGLTIEGTLEETLEKLLNEKVFLQAASRTDGGVHATGQVVNFLSKNNVFCSGTLSNQFCMHLNSLLPESIRVLSVENMPLNFHPTLDCSGKEYHYSICYGSIQQPQHINYSWHIPYPLNIALMRKSSEKLVGTHDFSAFCNVRKNFSYENYVRTVQGIEILELPENRLQIKVNGNHFLFKMVRNIVGTLVDVGKGKLQVEEISRILESGKRTNAGISAPAHGLFLYKVFFN